MISKLIYKVPEKYKFIYSERNVELPDSINSEIQNNWEELINQGKKYTNGDLYTVSNIKYDNNHCLIFSFLKTNYAHFLYTLKQNFEGDNICRSIATSGLFITSDNYYVLGEMAKGTALAGKIKFIGGAISNEDIIDNEFSPLECIKREINEEIGLNLDDKYKVEEIKEDYIITRKNLSFINIYFKIKLKLSSKEITDLFNNYKEDLYKNNIESELESIILIKNEKISIDKFLDENKNRVIEYMKDLFLVETGVNEARHFEEDIISY